MASIKPLKAMNAGVSNAPYAVVSVYLAGTLTLATLYSDAGGVTGIGNPTQLDANGRLHVYLADGRYDVLVTLGAVSFTVLNVEHISANMFLPVGASVPTTSFQLIEAGDVNYLAWNIISTDGINGKLQNNALPGRAMRYNSNGIFDWVYVAPTASSFALSSLTTHMSLSAAGILTGTQVGPISPTIAMSTPGAPVLNAFATGGALATGTHFYKITALDGAGGETTGGTEASIAVTGPNGSVALSWTAVPGAFVYHVWHGTSSNGENVSYLVFGTSYTDTGAAGISGSVPGSTTAFTVEIAGAAASWLLGGNLGIGTSTPQSALTVGPNKNLAIEIGQVGAPGLVAATTGGTKVSGTNYYVITAIDADGGETRAGIEASVVVTGPQGSVALTWTAPFGATSVASYRIYNGTTPSGENKYFTSTTTSFTDTGAAGTAGTPPTVTSAYAVRVLGAAAVRTPTIGPSVAQQHTLPVVASDIIALLSAVQTLTNKTLTSPTLITPIATTIGPSGAQQHALPAVTSDIVALLNATQTFGTGKTLVTPKIGTILDPVQGLTALALVGVQSAVNYLEIDNSATGVATAIAARGSDPSVDINFVPKGSGKIKGNNVVIVPRNFSATNPGGSRSTTNLGLFVSTGIGVGPITPAFLAALRYWMNTDGGNDTAGNGQVVALYRNTTGVPSNGTGVGSDTLVYLGQGQTTPANAAQSQHWGAAGVDTGRTVGTGYYYYIAYAAITGGTAWCTEPTLLVEE
jgi:hypothetical protein